MLEHPEIAEEIRLNLVEARKAENRSLNAPPLNGVGTTTTAAA